MKKKLIVAIVVTLVLFASLQILTVKSQTVARVEIGANRQFYVNGEPIILRGITALFTTLAITDWSSRPFSSAEQVFSDFQSWGVNSMRLAWNWEMLEPTRGQYSQSFLNNFDYILDLAEKYGIYIYPTMMQYQVSSYFGGSGNGFPPWVVTALGGLPEGQFFTALHASAEYTDLFGKAWQQVAQICAGRNIVIGYDILNEDEARGIGATNFLETIAPYIEQIDPNKFMIAENNFISQSVRPNMPNLVLSPHAYRNYYQSQTVQDIQNQMMEFENLARAWNTPTLCGEYTTLIDSGWSQSERAIWLEKELQAFDNLGWSSNWFDYWGNFPIETLTVLQDYFSQNIPAPPDTEPPDDPNNPPPPPPVTSDPSLEKPIFAVIVIVAIGVILSDRRKKQY